MEFSPRIAEEAFATVHSIQGSGGHAVDLTKLAQFSEEPNRAEAILAGRNNPTKRGGRGG